MGHNFGSLVFTPLVKALQEKYGSRRQYARVEAGGSTPDRLGPDESAFISERDSFYIASLGATGWPYVQHRGGPKGFLKVIDDHTIAFPDFRGNKQFVSTGNIASDNRVALIMVDYLWVVNTGPGNDQTVEVVAGGDLFREQYAHSRSLRRAASRGHIRSFFRFYLSLPISRIDEGSVDCS
jgi:predicted pyridoxine 5'-phosphate oxidase superfamily flavin-nucleotide-binding protein